MVYYPFFGGMGFFSCFVNKMECGMGFGQGSDALVRGRSGVENGALTTFVDDKNDVVRAVSPPTTLKGRVKENNNYLYMMAVQFEKCPDRPDQFPVEKPLTKKHSLQHLYFFWKSKGLIFEVKPDQFEVLK